ncbi:hypothetical protein ICM05_09930 [Leucobacter sp. cx-42]|uniref:hypothetical protein n=1 Tax=unclassified Leucobacter TaxID=2621730 RepID=UPI00165DB22D|nr:MULTISPECIES: hypothetical protein [unclassified Leucobacter]MBC9954956.1 hypothetical protein [Leucobacter sp. cx-42]
MSEQNAASGAVVITIREVWEQGQETRHQVGELATSVKELVSVNKRIDAQRSITSEHDARLDELETWRTKVEAQQRPKAPWWAVVGAVVGIITGIGALISLIAVAVKVAAVL